MSRSCVWLLFFRVPAPPISVPLPRSRVRSVPVVSDPIRFRSGSYQLLNSDSASAPFRLVSRFSSGSVSVVSGCGFGHGSGQDLAGGELAEIRAQRAMPGWNIRKAAP